MHRPLGMNAYESERWDGMQQWRSTTPTSLAERLPAKVQQNSRQAAEKAVEVWDRVPGNDAVEKTLAAAIQGGFDMALDVIESTVREPKVLQRVTKGLPIEAASYDDLRSIDLAVLDDRAPKNAKRRAALAAGHGAAVGFAAGGAAAAGASSGGMGALTTAGIVDSAILADTAAVSIGSMQGAASSELTTDTTRPAERAMMMLLLGALRR